eukprot:UN03929
MTAKDLHPVGSITKTVTATGILQKVVAGEIELDRPAYLYVDPFMKADNGTTLLELFPNEPRIRNITVRHLLAMQSGLGDYNDEALQKWTIDNPDKDWTPYDLLYNLTKTLLLLLVKAVLLYNRF